MFNVRDLVEERVNPTNNLFVTPGKRAQIIGAQNGGFPAFGHHVENEMGGVWAHPIKLLDGFWLGLKGDGQEFTWLKEASLFRNHPFYNEHIYEMYSLKITRKQFVPENISGVIVQYTFENKEELPLELEGTFLARTDLSPVWFSNEGGIFSGVDRGEIDENTIIVKDSKNDWFTRMNLEGVEGKIDLGEEITAYEETFGQGVGISWVFPITIEKGSSHTITFRVVGSIKSEKETEESMAKLADVERLFVEKERRYQQILDTASLDTPDKEFSKQYAWTKCHMEWLTTDVVGIGSGLTAGSPEYVWWFGCDSAYALAGCVPVGFHKLAESTLDTVGKASAEVNGNGRIVHEINTYGHVSNKGNTQETAHFIRAIHDTYKWTGNINWVKKHYGAIKQGIKWLFEEMDTDNDLFPEGYGIIEVQGLNGELIDTAVYTAEALKNAAEFADLFGEKDVAEVYRDLSGKLTEKILNEMWVEEEGLFADIRISGKVLYTKIDEFISQITVNNYEDMMHLIPFYNKLKEELLQTGLSESEGDTAWCFKNWVINTPIEVGMVDKERAIRALERLNSPEFTGEYGMFISGLEQTRMMTITAGVQANANLRYGLTDQALEQMKGTMKTFGMYLPGTHCEMSPNYGCFVQAWTSYGILSPVITGFIGARPDAANKSVSFNPQLPTDWDYVKVDRLKVGNNELNVKVTRNIQEKGGYTVEVTSKEADWTFEGAFLITEKD